MAILKRKGKKKEEAKRQAEDLASVYNIQYGPEGETFTIHAKDDATGAKGYTSAMLDAEKWQPFSRKKRLTTRYFQELAEKQNLAAIKKQQTDYATTINLLTTDLAKEKAKNIQLNESLKEFSTKKPTNKDNKLVDKNKVVAKKKKENKVVTTSTPDYSWTPQNTGNFQWTVVGPQSKKKVNTKTQVVTDIPPETGFWTTAEDYSRHKTKLKKKVKAYEPASSYSDLDLNKKEISDKFTVNDFLAAWTNDVSHLKYDNKAIPVKRTFKELMGRGLLREKYKDESLVSMLDRIKE